MAPVAGDSTRRWPGRCGWSACAPGKDTTCSRAGWSSAPGRGGGGAGRGRSAERRVGPLAGRGGWAGSGAGEPGGREPAADLRRCPPADLLLLCGIFGSVSDADIERTAAAAPALCAPGATVIWTRHRRPPDLTPRIRGWFTDAAFDEVAFEAMDTAALPLMSAAAARERAAVIMTPLCARPCAPTVPI
jgi:hypothetical protein